MNYKLFDNSEINNDEFNSLATHPLQSFQWGDIRLKTGLRVFRFGGFKNGKLEEVYTMTLHKVPKSPYFIGYIPKSKIPSAEFLTFLQSFSKDKKIIFIKFEPEALASNSDSQLTKILKAKSYKLQASRHPLFPQYTQILDLRPTEEDLMSNLKSKTRYNIRYAQKKGVHIKEESNDQGFDTFSKLYFETTKRQSYHGHDMNYHQTVWNGLKDNIAKILIAYHEDTPLAAYELFYFNKRFYYPYGGSSDLKRNLMASNLLMWEAILLGKKLGAYEFDMWGSLPPDYDEKNPWSGFTRFKQGYGAKIVKLAGSYDLVINPLIYTIYGFVYKIRSAIL